MRRRSLFWTALALLLGAALRFWFIHRFNLINGDGLIYGDIAKNWLLHGTYGRSEGSDIVPTLIRLPGYPLFLALCFRIFGLEHYGAVVYLQTAIDLLSCLLVYATVRDLCSAKMAMVALWLAALCPFTANYVAAPLTETLSVFCVALAYFALSRLLLHPGWLWVGVLAFSWSYATLLRPDGALLAVSCFLAMVLFSRRPYSGRAPLGLKRALGYAVTAGLLSLLPFVPWTLRNWQVFHVFEPLAPRYATDPGEFTAPGFQAWMKTWAAEFASTYEIYWSVNSDQLDPSLLPARAFDSPQQYRETRDLISDYNATTTLTPALDARFAALAEARKRAHPLRTYLKLPLLRIADMWLRPRTETLNIELRWWQYSKHHQETEQSAAYAALNLFYIVLALVGMVRWRREGALLVAAMLGYLVLRSLLLATIEAPEARYTVEAFPIFFILGALAFCRPSASSIRANE